MFSTNGVLSFGFIFFTFVYINAENPCGKNFFHCDNKETCVAKEFVCDGDNDCGDFSDEKDCIQKTVEIIGCEEGSFRCHDGLCIPQHWVCDGKADCLDGTDENEGCQEKLNCEDGFMCHNHICIPLEWKCDGNDDCNDGSDELNCELVQFDPTVCNVAQGKFLCSDKKKCLDILQVCNGIPECLDKSDENGLCLTTECTIECSRGQVCTKTPLKHICSCPSGQILESDTCKDIDECNVFGICDQKCVNFIGGYSCDCVKGYDLQSDNKTCKSSGGEGLLVFTTENEVRAYFLDSELYYSIANNITHASGIAYDGHNVYWSNIAPEEEAIVRSDEAGSNIDNIVTFGLGIPENIAVDWITGNIYFTDSQLKHIGICTKRGEFCTILHRDGLDNPRALALSPFKGIMYWSDWGKYHCIATSSMDGSNRTEFVNEDIHWPNGITIDFLTDRLYWVDAKRKLIESIKLDGTDRRVIVTEAIDQPFSIAVYGNLLYWSDWKGNQIVSCNKFSGKDMKQVVKIARSKIFNVYIYNPAIETTSVKNPCFGKCSHICLLAASENENVGFTCSCPMDLQLSSDRTKCEVKNYYDTIFTGSSHSVVEVDTEKIGKKSFKEYPLYSLGVLGSLAYNSLLDSIYVSDLHKHQIISIDRKNQRTSLLIDSKEDFIIEMDHDPYGNNLYWLDGIQNSIKVLSLRTMHKKTILSNFGNDKPVDFALAPQYGVMFVSLHNASHSHIDKITMDGSTRYHFIEKGLIGPRIALVYDHYLERIFWADQGTGIIMSCSINYIDFHKVREHLPGPIDIAILDKNIYWANYGSDDIFWVNKYDPSIPEMKTTIGKKGIDRLHLLSSSSITVENNTRCHNNGNCSHICLLSSSTQVCECPIGLKIDEKGLTCIKGKICGKNDFICYSGDCIPLDAVCNNVKDCPSGEDEKECEPPNKSCPDHKFSCYDSSYCIDNKNVCDSIEDCLDGSDEKNCHQENKVSSCNGEGKFLCNSGECISSAWRCDDRIDCTDHSDENDCKTNTCDINKEFKCNSGACIPSSWECDKELDCPDGSDEHFDCSNTTDCSSTHFACDNHKCIDKSLQCNGWDDCSDNSDEINCKIIKEPKVEVFSYDKPTITMCNQTHFTCTGYSGTCISISARCNGSNECKNNEDELGCGECRYGFFECSQVKECIPEVWVCDGVTDCIDKTDEDAEHCNIKKEKVADQKPKCTGLECQDSKKCIPSNKVCDGVPDCDDKSDESGLCGLGCEFAGCAKICQETPSGAQCKCPPGFTLNADGRNCDDINECLIKGTCSHFCHNTVGSFVCSCQEPYYQLREDRKRCKAKGPEMEFFFLSQGEIRTMTASLSRLNIIHNMKNEGVDGFALNMLNRNLYWTSKSEGNIYKLDLNTSSLIERNNHMKPSSIAVDWLTGNVYVVKDSNKIVLYDQEILNSTPIYMGDHSITVRAITVDPIKGLLFWSETYGNMGGNSRSYIKRSTMAGRKVETVLDHELQDINDLSIDLISEEIYWSDASLKQVGRTNYNGSKTEVILTLMDQPININIFEDHVYLTLKNSKYGIDSINSKLGVVEKCGIHASNRGECNYIRLLPHGVNSIIKKMKIYHLSLQTKGINKCDLIRCFGICVTSGQKPICLCSDGSNALTNGTCPQSLDFLNDENQVENLNNNSSHLGLVLALLFLLLVGLAVGFAYYFKINPLNHFIFFKSETLNNDIRIQFSNPAYELDCPLVEKDLMEAKNNNLIISSKVHQFENPAYRTFDSGPE